MESRFGPVEVNIIEEEKPVYYWLMENGKDLKRESEAILEGYEQLMNENQEKIEELLRKEELTLEDAEEMRDILDKFYTLGEVNDYTHCQGSYVFCVNETVRSYSLKEKADW